jgi:hypothetical protein
MHRVQVAVSILLVLFAGILSVFAGAWILAGLGSSNGGEHDGGSVLCLGIFLEIVGSLLCLAATCVAAWQKPWRPQ